MVEGARHGSHMCSGHWAGLTVFLFCVHAVWAAHCDGQHRGQLPELPGPWLGHQDAGAAGAGPHDVAHDQQVTPHVVSSGCATKGMGNTPWLPHNIPNHLQSFRCITITILRPFLSFPASTPAGRCRVAENRRVSSERQQSGLHWNASELLGSSPVVGSSLELVVSVPEDKEVSGEVELGRWVGSAAVARPDLCLSPAVVCQQQTQERVDAGVLARRAHLAGYHRMCFCCVLPVCTCRLPVNQAGASPLTAQLEPGDSIRQHQMQLAPLATAQHGAPWLSGQQGTGGSVSGASPVSARSVSLQVG